MDTATEPQSIGNFLRQALPDLFTPISTSQKTCPKHGIEYTEEVYTRFTRGCPECAKEAEASHREREVAKRAEADRQSELRRIEQRIGDSGIPKRFREKTISGYRVDNEKQRAIVECLKRYAKEFNTGHSGRNMALIGNCGTGKTHLACAVARHVIHNCGGHARFASVAEINRIVRESKSYDSDVSESEVIAAFGGYDLLIIDEVGVQSGTEAESRALFDVFNERYQNMKPTILISNLDKDDFKSAMGERIIDRIKEDGGEVHIFDWESSRG